MLNDRRNSALARSPSALCPPQRGSTRIAAGTWARGIGFPDNARTCHANPNLHLLQGPIRGRLLRDLPKLAVNRGEPETDLYDLIGRGEGTHLEFKSTMRTNLHTGKPGKEIELAWLKGVAAFLNTEGGILLMGVADDGEVLGLEVDAFANDDKCLLHFKNLVNQHLGPEYARFLRFELFQLAD